jgi:NagD protein
MLLDSHVESREVAAYGAKEFLDVLIAKGYKLNYKNPKTVLVATKQDFMPDEYAQMIEFLLNGASLVGMHETSIYAKNAKRYPGVGAVLKLLEFATSVSYTTIGKPSKAFYDKAFGMMKSQNKSAKFNKITMISDDVKGDLGGAKEMGMNTVFVTSGKYKSADEIVPFLDNKLRPDSVYADMKEILETL